VLALVVVVVVVCFVFVVVLLLLFCCCFFMVYFVYLLSITLVSVSICRSLNSVFFGCVHTYITGTMTDQL
jgi:hypothetical protein